MNEITPTKKYTAEFIGTLALVLVGCGSAVLAGKIMFGFTGVALAFGLTVLVMVYTIGPISGCHINPAITLAMLIAGKIEKDDAIKYMIAQVLGGIAGAIILYLIASGNDSLRIDKYGLGANSYENFGIMASFLAEVVFTFLFLFVIFGSTHDRAPKGFAGISIGFALVLIHLVSIPVTGTSVNPARSIGPALFSGTDAIVELWLFILAPMVGAALAAFVWKAMFDD